MIIKVSGLIIIRRQVGKGMRGTALVHRSLRLEIAENGPWRGAWGGQGSRGERGARRGQGGQRVWFALSQGRRAPQGSCRVTATWWHCGTQRHQGTFPSPLPAPPPWGHKCWGAQGPAGVWQAPEALPWCHPVLGPCRSPGPSTGWVGSAPVAAARLSRPV